MHAAGCMPSHHKTCSCSAASACTGAKGHIQVPLVAVLEGQQAAAKHAHLQLGASTWLLLVMDQPCMPPDSCTHYWGCCTHSSIQTPMKRRKVGEVNMRGALWPMLGTRVTLGLWVPPDQ
jgi:hypothetical protein